MTTKMRPLMSAGAALASVGALVVATPSAGAQMDAAIASASESDSLTPAFELLSKKSQWQGAYYDDDSYDDDDDDGDHGYGHSDDDDDDDGFGGFGGSIADFLANNQAQVLAVTVMIPVFYLGPVAVGNSLLATAYYDGYNGSATGLPGVISYVTSQLGLQTAPGGAAAVSVAAAAGTAEVTSSVAPAAVSLSRAQLVAPAASQKSDQSTDDEIDALDAVKDAVSSVDVDTTGGPADATEAKADTAVTPRSSARASTSAKAGSGHAAVRSARSAAKSAGDAS